MYFYKYDFVFAHIWNMEQMSTIQDLLIRYQGIALELNITVE